MLLKPKSPKVRENTHKHRLIRVLAATAVIVTVIFVGYRIITDNIQIKNNNRRLEELTAQTNAVKAENEQITGYLENNKNLETYIEKIARDRLDYANPDERIYYFIPAGN